MVDEPLMWRADRIADSMDSDEVWAIGPLRATRRRFSSTSPRRLPPRGASFFAVALCTLMLAVACSPEDGGRNQDQSDPPVRPASAEELASYVEAVRAVGSSVAEVVGKLEALAALMARSDRPRSTFEADARLLIEALRGPFDQLQSVDLIPARAERAHGSMKLALERYGEAAAMLLPPRHGGPDLLDFSTFDEKMADADEEARKAAALLP